MEMNVLEVTNVEVATHQAAIKQLTDLELVFVGGGIGETTL